MSVRWSVRIRCHLSPSTSFHGIKWDYLRTNKGSKSKPGITNGEAPYSPGLEVWRRHNEESEIFAFSSMPSSYPSPILIYPVLDIGKEVWNKHNNFRLKTCSWSRDWGRGKGSGSNKTRWNSLCQLRSMLLWSLGVSRYFGSIPVYPLYGYQGDIAETQILLQHHFCLKFFWDCFCLQEKPRLLNRAFKATRPHHGSHSSPCLSPPPKYLVIAEQLPAYEQARLFLTSVPLNMSSFLCLRHSSSFLPSSRLLAWQTPLHLSLLLI